MTHEGATKDTPHMIRTREASHGANNKSKASASNVKETTCVALFASMILQAISEQALRLRFKLGREPSVCKNVLSCVMRCTTYGTIKSELSHDLQLQAL